MALVPDTACEPLRDKRYIAYARCACAINSRAQLREQILLIRFFTAVLRMRCAGEVRLAGVNGITPLMRDDLRQLLARKRERNDFEVLVMRDFTRLTRAGVDEGRQIEAAFARCGVRVMYLSEMVIRP